MNRLGKVLRVLNIVLYICTYVQISWKNIYNMKITMFQAMTLAQVYYIARKSVLLSRALVCVQRIFV